MTVWYKRGHTQGGLVLLPETFKRLDRLKCTEVAMSQVHPCDWSLLSSTVLSVFTCVLFCHMCSDTCAQVFQESLGVPLTPQLVLPLQDCCAFWLVPLCTASMVEAMSRHVWLPPMPNICQVHHSFGVPGWVPTEAVQPKMQVETHLSCDPSLQVQLWKSEL